MRDPLVSVIIPVYNVKPYLSEAIHSIINQTYRNLEIIVIDDGSTDGSGDLCDDLAKEDERIRVYHQNNGGISAARNTGMTKITGEIISFMDSDDAFAPYAIREMVDALISTDADIAVCRYVECHTQGKMSMPVEENCRDASTVLYDRKTALRAILEDQIHSCAWNKIYRKICFQSIAFPEGHVFEDVDTIYRVFDRAETIVAIDRPLIMYRRRASSIIGQYDLIGAKDRERAFAHLENFVSSNIPEIFTEEHLQRIRRKRMEALLGVFAREEKGSAYRSDIQQLKQKLDQKKCERKMRIMLSVFSISPNLFRTLFRAYTWAKNKTKTK